MTPNKKLEHLIVGQTISAVEKTDTGGVLALANKSHLTIKGTLPTISCGIAIAHVWQQDATLRIGFLDGSTNDIALAAETSSVLMRDANGGFAYSD